MNIKFFLVLLTASIILSCKSEKEADVFQISGNLKNFEDEVFLLLKGTSSDTKSVLVAEKKQGNFIFKSKDTLPIGRYFVKIGNEPERIPILVDNTNVSIILDPTNLLNSYTEGNSSLQKIYSKYLTGSKSTNNLFDYQKRFIEENKNSLLGVIVLKDMLGPTQWRLKQSLMLYEQLDSTVQQSELGNEINNYITKGFENMVESDEGEILEIDSLITAQNSTSEDKIETESEPNLINEPVQHVILEYAPYFYGDGLDGIEVSAKEVFEKNKLTLIDFWASWCVPCRAQNPDYVRLYNKYHSRGFEILSIASDKETAKWQNAIVMDNMNWEHVIDPYNRIANTYNVGAIPYTILVNQQGGILAKRVSVSKLENLLRTEIGE